MQRSVTLVVLSLIFAGILVYANSLANKFVWDDNQLVVQNEYIRSFKYIPKIFTSDLYHFGYLPGNFYRPLQTLTYSIDYKIWKLNPFGYHLTNLILHILTGISVFFVVNIICDNHTVSFLTSLLFVIHPIHTEAVSYISGRADMLAAFFGLASFYLFIKGLGRPFKRIPYVFALFLYTLSLLSKEFAIIIPIIYTLYIQFFCEKQSKKKFILFAIPFFVVDLIYILLRISILNFAKTSVLAATASLPSRIYSIPRILLDYVRLVVFPLNLHMERDILALSSYEITLSVAALAIAAFFTLCSYKNKLYKTKTIFFTLWPIIFLLPVLNIIPINAKIAEHWLYIPSIGIFALVSANLVAFGERLFKRYPSRFNHTVVYAGLILFFVSYGVLTVKYNTFWRDNYVLYSRVLSLSPNSARVHNNLGKLYDSQQESDKAIAEYKKAIEIKPNYEIAYNNLGVALNSQRQFQEAIKQYKMAINLKPNFSEAHNNLGTTYRQIGLLEDAISEYKKALGIKPDYAEAYNNLGIVYYKKDQLREAIEEYKKAISVKPDLAEAHNNLGVAYAKMGLFEQAERCWKKTLEINPSYGSPLKNLQYLKKKEINLLRWIRPNKMPR